MTDYPDVRSIESTLETSVTTPKSDIPLPLAPPGR